MIALTSRSTPRGLRRSLDRWRRPSLLRWSLVWTLGGVILACSAIPDGLGEGGDTSPLDLQRAYSKGLPLPAPENPEDDALAIAQPLPEPGIPGLKTTFVPEDGALPQEPSWVPHLGPARPEVLVVAPKTGPPLRPSLA